MVFLQHIRPRMWQPGNVAGCDAATALAKRPPADVAALPAAGVAGQARIYFWRRKIEHRGLV
jgi:hypothetical protein